MSQKSEAEDLLAIHLEELGLHPQRQVQFHPERKWRLDFLCQDREGRLIAIEIQGGIWSGGRHTRGSGYQDDLDKHNAAVIAGHHPLYFSTRDVKCGKAKETVAEFLKR